MGIGETTVFWKRLSVSGLGPGKRALAVPLALAGRRSISPQKVLLFKEL